MVVERKWRGERESFMVMGREWRKTMVMVREWGEETFDGDKIMGEGEGTMMMGRMGGRE